MMSQFCFSILLSGDFLNLLDFLPIIGYFYIQGMGGNYEEKILYIDSCIFSGIFV